MTVSITEAPHAIGLAVNLHLYIPHFYGGRGRLRKEEHGDGDQAGNREGYRCKEPEDILQTDEGGVHSGLYPTRRKDC